ncbi:unnamed protein product [Onchocerca flexuosa]|uniref:EF-hand domain-containing protein n=1 Tax=Onchocerca flexuosa TaxID=387005 RepID=A0A183HVI1_9BILA|nr:unnamed protein product [Onchocerca flexuosa]
MKFFILLTTGLLAVTAIPQQRGREQLQQQQPNVPEAPPFLQGAPPNVINDFFNLLKADENKTDAETELDVEKFIDSLGGNYRVCFCFFFF